MPYRPRNGELSAAIRIAISRNVYERGRICAAAREIAHRDYFEEAIRAAVDRDIKTAAVDRLVKAK
jgi:hypothetical protein